MVFTSKDFDNHELVTYHCDPKSNLKAIIAVHSTKLGPALGGCRMWPYMDEDEALTDVLRLSRSMTYKAAMARLPLGGGKAVIIADPKKDKTPELFQEMGRFINHLHGLFITAEDVGTSVEDMHQIYTETPYVSGLHLSHGGSGDPSPYTALGIYRGMLGAVEYKLKKKSLKGLRVIVQGLGHVGMSLCETLHKEGAKLYVSDIDPTTVQKAVQNFEAMPFDPEKLYDAEADIFAPCALGGILNDETIPRLKVKIIAGSANNQLAETHHGRALLDRGILYAPDYIINAGGLINVFYEGPDYDRAKTVKHINQMDSYLLEVFKMSDDLNISTSEAADQIAEERLKG
ncbi:MAG: Glu/Leu/Phe/Val dehydrogenase [Alphaproteobacteria bacterium]|jgi:leucine dehydrogenase|nr:Glu/Leu/Phe/Val dehydrogenase [Alphaproteobacteria bacterium]MBT5389641.1 Glu/Leu/Phe/Val dehydrogenase [Alphaproteobacteria bacterium]MBT5654925.1 Glu/Leu/Phe/Val dehydrogenase [Alphaproteobacteria bacterium]